MIATQADKGHENGSWFFAGGQLVTGGRVLNYREQENRQLCRLFMSLAGKMNLPLEKFGDATEPLAEV